MHLDNRELRSGYQRSSSLSLLGTSSILGLSMILAVLVPASTTPMIQEGEPSSLSSSLQKVAASSLGRQINRPPEHSADSPCRTK